MQSVQFNNAQELGDILKTMGVNIPQERMTNANEVMHTANTGKGEEFVEPERLSDQVFDAVPNYSTFLNALPGNHGNQLAEIESKPIIGDLGFFEGGTERTDQPTTNPLNPTGTAPTAKVQINQKQYVMRIDLSDHLRNFQVGSAGSLESLITQKMASSMARTVEGVILNGDTETGASANINLIDGTPASTAYYLKEDGIRKAVIGAADSEENIGTLTFNSYVDLMDKIGDYAANPEDVLQIVNRSVYNKSLALAEFKDISQNGKNSTIHTGALTNVLGSDLYIARDLQKATATGEISGTPANNTTGQMLAMWKYAVQYGFGGKVESQPLRMMIHNFGSQGIQLEAWFYFGFALINKKAGQTDPSFGYGRNVTL